MIFVAHTPHTTSDPEFGPLIGLSLRRHGVIPSEESDVGKGPRLALAPRGARVVDALAADAAVMEGPLSDDDLARLCVSGTLRRASSLTISGPGLATAKLLHPRFTVRHHTVRDDKPVLESRPGGYPLGAGTDGSFAYTAFVPDEAWRPALEGSADGSSETVVLAVTNGRVTLIGFPLFHMLGAALGWPDLESGYYAFEEYSQTGALESWLVCHVQELARAVVAPVVQIAPWPKGFAWAVLIRHDYDRLITDSEFAELIDGYRAFGIRPNWFFLPHKLIEHQARWLVDCGHEVALHTTAGAKQEFEEQHRALSRVLGRTALGVTAHGGDYPGFLGDLQYAWAESCGMTYSEAMGSNYGFPFVGVTPRGGVAPLGLMLMPGHVSLDAGTGEHQHHFESCLLNARNRRRQGAAFQVMSHPDIHRSQLRALIEQAEVADSWRPTMPELASWARSTRYDVRLAREGARVVLRGGSARTADAVVSWTCGDKHRTATWSSGDADISF
jgi:hypothetical protein